MKKTFLAIVSFLFIGGFVSAQQAQFGFTGGITFANMKEKTSVVDVHGNYGFGVTFGVLLDQPMQKNGSFQVGLNFTQKNPRRMPYFLGTTGSITNVLNYIEMPMNVVFKFNHGSGRFMAGAGVSTALALWGTSKTNVTKDKSLKFGNGNDDDLKGIDFGLTGLIGYEFSGGSSFTLNYTQGLNTLYIGGPAIDKLKNRYFGLRYGYLLKHNTSKKKK